MGASRRTAASSAACSSRRPPSPRTTPASRGCSLAWRTATPSCTMTSGSRSSRTWATTSSWTTLSRASRRTRRAARCTSRPRWLFLGVANSDALLYDDEWQPIVKNFPDNFKLDYALSREQKNKAGGKMYIQDKVGEYADEVFTRMDNGGHMYFCGLKGMMPGILEMLDGVSKEKGIVWEDKLKEWKKNGQWHVEVY